MLWESELKLKSKIKYIYIFIKFYYFAGIFSLIQLFLTQLPKITHITKTLKFIDIFLRYSLNIDAIIRKCVLMLKHKSSLECVKS